MRTEHKFCTQESDIFEDHASEMDMRAPGAVRRHLEVSDLEVIV
jgi:hypothetical protein